MRIAFSVAMAFSAVMLGAYGDALDELVPQPRRIVREEAVVHPSVLRKVVVRTGDVAGAPESVAEESYMLDISADGVVITAPTERGVRYAKVTLDQLGKLAAGSSSIPSARIWDWPKLRWRGFMPDTARNFLDVESVKDVIEVMAMYKLNLFHWHLTEYYGWRLQSKRYPELEKKGYYDPCGSRHHGKFYTQEEFREVVDFAAARGVTVMPEFDIPGHAEAFRRAFGFKSMSDPGVVDTLVDLVNELCALASKEKMPFVHLGGDEVRKEWEKFNPGDMTRVAQTVSANGRVVVTWDPGEKFESKGPRIAMLWDKTQAADCPWFDARGWYIDMYDPFEILSLASYHAPFYGETGDARQQGAIFCAWHDLAVGLPYSRFLVNQPVFPAVVAFGDLYWHGRAYQPTFSCRRLPLAGDPALDIARDLERRMIAQRDRVLTDLRHPFHFVRQTQMRWRMSDSDGRLIVKDLAQGSVFPYYKPGAPQNLVKDAKGKVIVETWIRSPDDREVGAWIGFTAYDRDHGFSPPGGTPELGQWNRFGAMIELNDEPIPPPVWQRPGLDRGKRIEGVTDRVYEIEEMPLMNDEWYLREPTKIRLRKGWNHVKMTLPMPKDVVSVWSQRWVGTFMPVAGTTDHPREIDELEYSSEPRE